MYQCPRPPKFSRNYIAFIMSNNTIASNKLGYAYVMSPQAISENIIDSTS